MNVGSGVLLLSADGRVTQATALAARLIARAAPADLTAALRSLAARCRHSDLPAVETVPVSERERLVLTGARAGQALTAIVELHAADADRLATLPLTARERDVTHLVLEGLPTKAIAARLGISPWTVQDNLKAIFAKTGVGSRGQLVALVSVPQSQSVRRRAAA